MYSSRIASENAVSPGATTKLYRLASILCLPRTHPLIYFCTRCLQYVANSLCAACLSIASTATHLWLLRTTNIPATLVVRLATQKALPHLYELVIYPPSINSCTSLLFPPSNKYYCNIIRSNLLARRGRPERAIIAFMIMIAALLSCLRCAHAHTHSAHSQQWM